MIWKMVIPLKSNSTFKFNLIWEKCKFFELGIFSLYDICYHFEKLTKTISVFPIALFYQKCYIS